MNINTSTIFERIIGSCISDWLRYSAFMFCIFFMCFGFYQQAMGQTWLTVNGKTENLCSGVPIIGKVFMDRNKNGYADNQEAGVAGVELYSAQGLRITTDNHGRYHIACPITSNKKIGSNFVLKIDESLLPSGYHLTSENPRVVRLSSAKLNKVNFGIARNKTINLDLTDAAFVLSSDTLKLEYSNQLIQIVEALKGQDSTLRINYFTSTHENRSRIENLNKVIRELWDIHGEGYNLNIERMTLSPH